MSEILNRFSFSSAQWNWQVALCLGFIWVAIVLCAISSVRTQGFGELQRRFWIVVVLALPIVGVLAYLPFSFRREDLPTHFLSRAKDRPRGPRNTPTPGAA